MILDTICVSVLCKTDELRGADRVSLTWVVSREAARNSQRHPTWLAVSWDDEGHANYASLDAFDSIAKSCNLFNF